MLSSLLFIPYLQGPILDQLIEVEDVVVLGVLEGAVDTFAVLAVGLFGFNTPELRLC